MQDWIRILKRDNEDGWRLSAFYSGNKHTGGTVFVSFSLGSLGLINYWFGKKEWLKGFQREEVEIENLVEEQGLLWRKEAKTEFVECWGG